MLLGVNLGCLTTVLKHAKDDIVPLKTGYDADVLNLTYEAQNADRVSRDTDYGAGGTMPASVFSRIVEDLTSLGESVPIEVSKRGGREWDVLLKKLLQN